MKIRQNSTTAVHENSTAGGNNVSIDGSSAKTESPYRTICVAVAVVLMIVMVAFPSGTFTDPRLQEETAQLQAQFESCQSEREMNDKQQETARAQLEEKERQVKELTTQLEEAKKENEALALSQKEDAENQESKELQDKLTQCEEKLQSATMDSGNPEMDREMIMALRSEPMIAVENPVQTFRICSEQKGVWGALVLNRFTRLIFPKCNFVYNVQWRKSAVASNIQDCELWYSGGYGPEDSRGKGHGQPFLQWTMENSCEGERDGQEPLLAMASKEGADFCHLVPQVTTPLLNFIGADRYEDFSQQPDQFIPLPQYASKTEKKYFLAYANSHCIDFRDEFFQTVLNRTEDPTRTHSLFGCLHNFDVTIDMPDRHYDKGMFELYSDYKFVMALENERGEASEHYMTEKILRPHIAQSIPIYMGATELAKRVFNPKRIVFVEDFDSFEACVEFLMELDANDEKYQAMLAEPVFPPEGMHEGLDFQSSYHVEAARKAAKKFIDNDIYNESPLRQCVQDPSEEGEGGE